MILQPVGTSARSAPSCFSGTFIRRTVRFISSTDLTPTGTADARPCANTRTSARGTGRGRASCGTADRRRHLALVAQVEEHRVRESAIGAFALRYIDCSATPSPQRRDEGERDEACFTGNPDLQSAAPPSPRPRRRHPNILLLRLAARRPIRSRRRALALLLHEDARNRGRGTTGRLIASASAPRSRGQGGEVDIARGSISIERSFCRPMDLWNGGGGAPRKRAAARCCCSRNSPPAQFAKTSRRWSRRTTSPPPPSAAVAGTCFTSICCGLRAGAGSPTSSSRATRGPAAAAAARAVAPARRAAAAARTATARAAVAAAASSARLAASRRGRADGDASVGLAIGADELPPEVRPARAPRRASSPPPRGCKTLRNASATGGGNYEAAARRHAALGPPAQSPGSSTTSRT